MVSAPLKAGDTLWSVNRWRKDAGSVARVKSIGRKYVHLQNGTRLLILDLLDGNANDANHSYYLSEQDHLKKKTHALAFTRLMRDIDRLRMSDMTLEQITKAREVLGLEP